MLLSLLRSWWRRRSRSLSRSRWEHLRLVLYTRAGCHLCDVAHRQLRDEQLRRGFILEVVDIATDPELTAQYGEQVPVVTLNGKLRFRGAVNPVLLDRLLRAEAVQ
jgi:glutaredoxin